ncbi:MAG: ankyrin repeat domain-containing protein, partial [Planctomycetota bacterium]
MESWLIQITNYLLAQSWQIVVLTIAVALVSILLRNRNAHVRYLLWLIVLAKCLVPPLYSIPIAVLPQEESSEYVHAPPIAERVVTEYRVPEVAILELSRPTSAESEVTSSPVITGRPVMYNIRAWLAIGWLAGVAALSFYYLFNALRTQFWLQKQRKALPGELGNDIESIFMAHGVRHMPRIWLLDRINQPFVWGLVRGSIYLPAELVDGKQAEFKASILGHEHGHVIRLDAMINSLQVIAQTVFWFHPFVWWANRRIRDEREKCCDEMTIASFNTRPEDYGEAIVETLAAKYEQARPIPSLAVAGQVKNLEERIRTMLRPGRRFYRRPSLVAATVVVLMALLTVPSSLVLTAKAETKTDTSLHKAAVGGDIEQVKMLISKGTDVNAKDESGMTTLHRVSNQGQKDIAELLIAKGADIEAKNNDGRTPLHIASHQGQKEVAEMLISKGADINAKDNGGRIPLYLAAGQGHRDVAELLIAKGADIDTKNNMDRTSLYIAARRGHRDVVELLIAKGANIDVKGENGLTLLHVAAERGHKEVAELLISKGSDINAQNNWGWTPLHITAYQGQKDVAELLINKGAEINGKDNNGYIPLHLAAQTGQREIAELLLNKGADFKVQTSNGRTAVGLAKEKGHTKIVELLSKHANQSGETKGIMTLYDYAALGDIEQIKSFESKGMDINAKAQNGTTALHWASIGHIDVAEYLISKGFDIHAKDNNGMTPLHCAAASGQKDVAELLINKGAEINSKNNNGYIPLYLAVSNNQKDVVELLISKGADVNARRNKGGTPLHRAAVLGHKEVAKLLLESGADIKTKNNGYRTPLWNAVQYGHKDVAELLITKGADMNVRDNAGR